MKTKLCLFALCLASGFLPAMALGADMELMDKGEQGGGKTVGPRSVRILPVIIETGSGTVNISFTCNLGVVNIQLQDAIGLTAVDQQFDTSVENQVSFHLSAGSYTLTATTADEVIITQVIVIVP